MYMLLQFGKKPKEILLNSYSLISVFANHAKSQRIGWLVNTAWLPIRVARSLSSDILPTRHRQNQRRLTASGAEGDWKAYEALLEVLAF
jgi:hypothetical protein